MANSITPRDLTQVAIQPSASPISLNVLPAPGQRLAGNTLQQIGESLAAFNPSLQGMLAQRVEEDKRFMAAQGAAVDFSKAFDVPMDAPPEERQAALNKAFKDAIAKQGGPDSANPFFLIAARQNYGRAIGLRYRNALASMRDQATDPDNPASFGDIAAKAAEMAGVSEATADVYGASGFASVAQETNAEMMMRFQEERRRRQEFVNTERVQNGIADALKVAAANPEGFSADSPVGRTMQEMIDSYQLTTTDPETSRKMVLGAFVTALSTANDEMDAEEMVQALGQMSFGKALIRDNVALYSRLLTAKDERVRELDTREARRERLFKQQIQTGIRSIYGMNWAEEITGQIMIGNETAAQEITNKKIDEWATQSKADTTVANMVRSEMQGELSRLYSAVGTQRNAVNSRNFETAFGLIDDGTITTSAALGEWMDDRRLTVEQQLGLRRYFSENVGVVRTAAGSYASLKGKEIQQRILTGMASSGMLPVNPANMQPMIGPDELDKAQSLEESWRDGANKRVQMFVRGETKDPASGLTYAQIKQESGVEAANRSINGILDSYYDERIKDYNEVQRANKAASDAGVRVGRSEQPAATSFIQDQAAATAAAVNQVVQSFDAAPLNVEQQAEVIKASLETEIGELYGIARDFGMAPPTIWGRATVNYQSVAERLGQMIEVANTQGIAKTRRMGFLISDDMEFTKDSLLQQYGKVKRSPLSGLSPEEILSNQTYEGLPVFGVVIPNRGQAVEFAFSVPMFRTRSQMTDPTTVNKVMDALGLPQDRALREAWIARQSSLLRLSETLGRMNTAGNL